MVIGYTTGVFDMFHIGHLNILRRAKEQCDFLIVGVSTDELVEHEKNKTPIIPFEHRCQIIEAIRYVDQVVPQYDKNKLGAWQQLHYDKMFVGSDWQGTPQWKMFEEQLNPLGVEIVYLSHTDGISSSILRDKITPRCGQVGKIGYTQGTFDMFHVGHLNLLRQAKEQCSILIVGVNADTLVEEYKHHKPIIGENERAKILQAIRYVDNVVICDTLDKMKMHNWLHFDAIFIGNDWEGNARWRQTEIDLQRLDASVVYLKHTAGVSSTLLREKKAESSEEKDSCMARDTWGCFVT